MPGLNNQFDKIKILVTVYHRVATAGQNLFIEDAYCDNVLYS